MTTSFRAFFEEVIGRSPYPWQDALGADATCRDRSIRIPTGFGKTAAVVLAWLFHCVHRRDTTWPRRLVFCLPMRVLVEQTERAVRQWLDAAGHRDLPVFVLLGGREEARWVDRVDRPAVLIGTQDMLLSRALNRGYGSARGLWPMEMGLLQHDALWVVDEVQLMDVGLATTAQFRAFRIDDAQRERVFASARTWWMSATFQRGWLDTVDHARVLGDHALASTTIPTASREGGLWDVKKAIERDESVAAPQELAACVRKHHRARTVSLLIVNTVDRAVKAFTELQKLLHKDGSSTDLRLVHSRFRGAEREVWTFLRRDACESGIDRILVATQVVEAGVDLSARLLVTDLAPWSSLVQRFGRCARYEGEQGHVIVASPAPDDDKKAAPYDVASLAAAHEAVARLVSESGDAGPRSVEQAEEQWRDHDPSFVARLFPYEPLHVLRRHDFDDLFDTTPDLSGADLDVSHFIRTGDERDVRVFWRRIEGQPRALADVEPPARTELCPVPVGALLDWLKKAGTRRTNTALLALSSDTTRADALPPVHDALRRMEVLHDALVRESSRSGGEPSPCFTGKDGGKRLEGHGHASLIPLNLSGRSQRLDHVLVHAPMGLDDGAREALGAVRKTYAKDLPDVFVALAGLGERQAFEALVPHVRRAARWRSATPFVASRYLKPRGADALAGQVRAELRWRGLPEPVLVELELDDGSFVPLGSAVFEPGVRPSNRFRHFRRARLERRPPSTRGFSLRLTFAEPVVGPVTLGYASHFGLGVFVPVD